MRDYKMKVVEKAKKTEHKGILPMVDAFKPSEYTHKREVTRGTKAQRSGRGFTVTESK